MFDPEITHKCYNICAELVKNCDPHLFSAPTEKVKFYAPMHFINWLNPDRSSGEVKGVKCTIMGYEVLQHSYNEVVLAHDDYPLFQNDYLRITHKL